MHPNLNQQIWKSSDQALLDDRVSYQRALDRGDMPEMHGLWQEALDCIEREIESRYESQQALRPFAMLEEAPF